MIRFALSLCCVTAVVGGVTGCGIAVQPTEGFKVSLQTTSDCTITGVSNRNCEDEDALAAQRTFGRWVVQHGADLSFSVLLHDGSSMSGIYFNDDTTTLNEPPCVGGSDNGLCYFARAREATTQEDGCTSSRERILILLRESEDAMGGVLVNQSETTEGCTTQTQSQVVVDVAADIAPVPSLAGEEAAK